MIYLLIKVAQASQVFDKIFFYTEYYDILRISKKYLYKETLLSYNNLVCDQNWVMELDELCVLTK